jgi:4-diphosphocytidyl-2-C-methyl-D-erythritol kinase
MKRSLNAPAKINLGLEILGKRPDAFHEICTILQMIELTDRVTVAFAPDMVLTCDDPTLETDDNLALLAARRWSSQRDPQQRSLSIHIEKKIPAAAGLGGASADAAAVLILAEELARCADGTSSAQSAHLTLQERSTRLHDLAASLGSDVPFFLGSAAALATGRGEHLQPITPLDGVLIVLATPDITIERKTASMYGALNPTKDFSDGNSVRTLRRVMDAGGAIEPRHLGNAFSRPLRSLYPELEEMSRIMGCFSDGRVGLSGAGPTWYALPDSAESAQAMCRVLESEFPTARIVTTRTSAHAPVVMAAERA